MSPANLPVEKEERDNIASIDWLIIFRTFVSGALFILIFIIFIWKVT